MRVKISEIGRIVTGKTPSTKYPTNYGGDIPFVSPTDMGSERYVQSTQKTLSKEGLSTNGNTLLPDNSVLVSCIASVEKTGIIKTPSVTNQQINSIEVDSTRFCYLYVYYHLQTLTPLLIQMASGGSVQPIINKTGFSKIELDVPSLEIQRAIAHILGMLDDKIEMNLKINETLQGIAKALFKSWFVDFDPVRAKVDGRSTGLHDDISELFPDSFENSKLGEIPRGWINTNLSEIAVLNPESWSARNHPENVQYVDLAGVKNGRIDKINSYEWPEAPSRAKRILNDGDTIVGTVRPGNRSFCLVQQRGLTGSTSFAVLRPKDHINAFLVSLVATSEENIQRLSHLSDGGAYPAVKPEVVLNTSLVVPTFVIQKRFGELVMPLFRKVVANERNSLILSNIRDTLLPKLISGELRVPDAEKMIEEVGGI